MGTNTPYLLQFGHVYKKWLRQALAIVQDCRKEREEGNYMANANQANLHMLNGEYYVLGYSFPC